MSVPRSGSFEQLPERTDAHIRLMRATIRTLGSGAYRSFYAPNEEGEIVDVTQGGKLSCAYYLSRLLVSQGLLPCPHVTVPSTLTCMTANGWSSAEEERVGDTVLWTKDDELHLGLVVPSGMYATNSSIKRVPVLLRQEDSTRLGEPTFFTNQLVAANPYSNQDFDLFYEDYGADVE